MWCPALWIRLLLVKVASCHHIVHDLIIQQPSTPQHNLTPGTASIYCVLDYTGCLSRLKVPISPGL